MQHKIAQGIIIPLEGRYIKFTKSNRNEIVVNSVGTEVRFIEGEDSSTYSALVPEVELLTPYIKFQETDWYKLSTATYKIGCIEISKNTEYDYVFSQYICRGIDQYIMYYTDSQCTILIPESKVKLSTQDEYDSYVSIINSNPYITLESIKEEVGYDLSNFYLINLSSFSTVNTSINRFVFDPEKVYDKFRLRTIDVQASFLEQFTELLKSRSIQLIKKVRDTRLATTNQISYDITTIDKQINPRNLTKVFDPVHGTQLYEMELSFEASFTDYILMENFRRDYENYTYISNFTVFDSTDKYGVKWSSSIWWEPINTDTTLDFNTDSDGKYSFPLQFNCKIRYFVVMDTDMNTMSTIKDIIANLYAENNEGTIVYSDKLLIGSSSVVIEPEVPKYLLKVVSDKSVVSGSGLYDQGSIATISCTPNQGYEFVKWSNGYLDNPLNMEVTKSEYIIPIMRRTV